MEAVIRQDLMSRVLQELSTYYQESDIVEISPSHRDEERDSLSEIFNEDLDSWARRALGASGFGDY